jgi:hypothetical protein
VLSTTRAARAARPTTRFAARMDPGAAPPALRRAARFRTRRAQAGNRPSDCRDSPVARDRERERDDDHERQRGRGEGSRFRESVADGRDRERWAGRPQRRRPSRALAANVVRMHRLGKRRVLHHGSTSAAQITRTQTIQSSLTRSHAFQLRRHSRRRARVAGRTLSGASSRIACGTSMVSQRASAGSPTAAAAVLIPT